MAAMRDRKSLGFGSGFAALTAGVALASAFGAELPTGPPREPAPPAPAARADAPPLVGAALVRVVPPR